MSRAAAVLIAIALAGNPSAKLACDLWCFANTDSRGMDHSAGHDAPETSHGGPSVQALPETCGGDAILELPFVPEVRQRALEHDAGTVTFSAVVRPLLELHRMDGATLLRGDAGPPSGHTRTPLRI